MSTCSWTEIPLDNQFGFPNKWFKCEASGTILPDTMLPVPRSALFHDFNARPDDLYIVSFPKCGASWLQEIVWLIANKVDFEAAKKTKADDRIPFVEIIPHRITSGFFDEIPSPRIMKLHLNHEILPKQIVEKKCKIIYQVRNPKDVCVSYYHFSIMNNVFAYKGDFETFFNLFIEDKLPYSPFWTNVKSFWNRRHEDNILFLKYEDFHRNFMENAKAIAKFLKVNLSDEDFLKIKDHCSFKKMKVNPATNYDYWNEIGLKKKGTTDFMRKGVAGDWKNHFTDEMNEKMDEWIKDNTAGTGITFDYEV
ncbi:SULT1B1 (predicted) [Pycnogonum litorale]